MLYRLIQLFLFSGIVCNHFHFIGSRFIFFLFGENIFDLTDRFGSLIQNGFNCRAEIGSRLCNSFRTLFTCRICNIQKFNGTVGRNNEERQVRRALQLQLHPSLLPISVPQLKPFLIRVPMRLQRSRISLPRRKRKNLQPQKQRL